MNKLNAHRTGMVLGSLFAIMHAGWAILVAVGLAQRLVDFVFRLHLIAPSYTILPFNWGKAVLLVIVTGVIGYVLGHIFAWLWNKIHR